jgi:tRNA-splicing ligase RtcB
LQTLVEQDRVPIKLWTDGVPLEAEALQQIRNVASLPIVGPWVAVMPDAHFGMGATVGSVIPTRAAIIPAAVGVDLGCGMMAVRTKLVVEDLEDKLPHLRASIENGIPHGGPGVSGSWDERGYSLPKVVSRVYELEFDDGYELLVARYPGIKGKSGPWTQLGTLGTGNHFIEVTHDETGAIWMMLHSGSRGVGNRIGTYFINEAREEALRLDRHLPDANLGWLDEGSELFKDYMRGLAWAQRYAFRNRELMMASALWSLEAVVGRKVELTGLAVNCHHNYVEQLTDTTSPLFKSIYVTRKGAVSAKLDEWGIIPGSMGTKSYIVRGLGSAESLYSCSHGAGRRMSRGAAKRLFTLDDVASQTSGVECRKDEGIRDELPGAYKDLDDVMAAQADLVRIEYTLKALVCVKG